MTYQNPRVVIVPIEEYFHLLLRECPTPLHSWQQIEVFRQAFEMVDGKLFELREKLHEVPNMALIFHAEQFGPWVEPFKDLVRKITVGIYLYCVENRLFDTIEVNGHRQWSFPYLVEHIEPHYCRLVRTGLS